MHPLLRSKSAATMNNELQFYCLALSTGIGIFAGSRYIRRKAFRVDFADVAFDVDLVDQVVEIEPFLGEAARR
jgi:hypothetical protein